jgi:hypothetical protein
MNDLIEAKNEEATYRGTGRMEFEVSGWFKTVSITLEACGLPLSETSSETQSSACSFAELRAARQSSRHVTVNYGKLNYAKSRLEKEGVAPRHPARTLLPPGSATGTHFCFPCRAGAWRRLLSLLAPNRAKLYQIAAYRGISRLQNEEGCRQLPTLPPPGPIPISPAFEQCRS